MDVVKGEILFNEDSLTVKEHWLWNSRAVRWLWGKVALWRNNPGVAAPARKMQSLVEIKSVFLKMDGS